MSDKDKADQGISYVALVADPFAYPDLEIAQAQENPEPLSLDELVDSAPPNESALADWVPDEKTQPAQNAMTCEELQSCIEALLFMTDKPLSPDRLREMIGAPEHRQNGDATRYNGETDLFQQAMTALIERYGSATHGIEIVEVAHGYQLRTKPARAELAQKLAKPQTQRLSSGAMETLAIVAYRQPVMKEDLDKIRGVDSSYFVRHLLDRKLIEISGRSDLPGRPMLYSTTDGFLSLFGLKDLSCLPSLREIEQMVPSSETPVPGEEDPRIREMRRMVGQMKADAANHPGHLGYDPREDERILAEIREKVSAIPTSTPYLDQQRELEKQAAEASAEAPLETPQREPE